MPDSPCCGVTCGMWESGFICPNCHKTYSFSEGRDFPNYIVYEVVSLQLLYLELISTDLLRQGCNSIKIYDDAIVIGHFNDWF